MDGNPSSLDEPMQCGVERPLLDLQKGGGPLFDERGDGVAVRRSAPKRVEHEHVERAWEQT